MTIRDFPRSRYEDVCIAWLGPEYWDALSEGDASGATGLNAAPDLPHGVNNPDEVTTRFEWTTDLTTEEAAAWDDMVKVLTGGIGAGPSQAEVSAAIDQVQAFTGRSVDPTAQQTWDTIDAMAVVLKHLWTRDD